MASSSDAFLSPSLDAVTRLRRQAQEAERVGRAAEAVGLLHRAVGLDATDAALWRELAQAQLGARRNVEALRAAERALALAPEVAAGHRLKAVALARLGRLDAAAAALAEVERREPRTAETLALKALLLMLAGRLEEADRLFTPVLAAIPGLAEAQANHAQVLSRLNRHEAALKAAEAARAAKPELPGVHLLLGMLLERLGRQADARTAYERALGLDPTLAEAHHALARLMRAQGDLDDAVSGFRRAVALSPEQAEFRQDLLAALGAAGRHEEAGAREAVRLAPLDAVAHIRLGGLLLNAGSLEEAETVLRRALDLDPRSALAYNNLACLHKLRGEVAEAIACLRKALDQVPDHPAALANLGFALSATDVEANQLEALTLLSRAIALQPEVAEAHCCLGLALQQVGGFEIAEVPYRRAIALHPRYEQAINNLAVSLAHQGRLGEVRQLLTQALKTLPGGAQAHSTHLFFLNYLPDQDRAAVLAEHRAWDARHGGGRVTPLPPPAAPRDPARRLRLGLVSGDLGRHPVAQFLLPLLRHLDPAAVEVHAYSNRAVEDATSAALRALTAGWRRTLGVSDRELARQIRADGIDILLDLAGHTNGNRLAVFAHRPAPLQVSWLGYPNTTGLGAIDYRLTDAVADPEGADAFHTERLVRLPRGFLCYQPPAEAPEITPPPARRAGAVTFGSFNNLTKVTPPAVAVWAAILHRVAGARLVVKSHQLSDAGNRGRLRGLFEAHGIDGARLELVDWRPRPVEHLAALARVDIALDSFPYTGTATTCEALWMGVPVVTWAGDRHAGRVSASLLNQAGLGELVARDAAEYVQLAVALAGDRERLERYRQDLRGRLRASPLCDGAGFARQFEQTMRALWRNWCAGA